MRTKLKLTISLLLTAIFVVTLLFAFAGCDENVPFEELQPTTNTTNFQSKSTAQFDNINGKKVTVDLFKRNNGEALNNPNVGQGLLIYQCIEYKKAHPEQDVEITLTSFHLSVVAALCVKRDDRYFGYMKSLYDTEYDDDGFVRLSYLLVYAAKLGIKVTVVGQIDANPVEQQNGSTDDYHFDEYFNSHLADEALIEGKHVYDFMTFQKANWTSYGDKSASDMMHVKSCTVSHYLDKDGKEHGGSSWLGSTNLDGINRYGVNGNDGIQTGVIISDHEGVRNVIANYTSLMAQYCGQEEIGVFRDLVVGLNTQQIDLISQGRSDEIPQDKAIVYLGTEQDDVFEMYFTPFGGSPNTWDTKYNPYAKYISKLLPSVSNSGSITLAWNNVKYLTNFEFSRMLTDVIKNAFEGNARITNKLYLKLPGIDVSAFDGLVVGENIGVKHINERHEYIHSKDLQLSYMEDFERYYVTMFNSLNFHQGAMSYQTNTMLVIKETKKTGNKVYVSFGAEVTNGVITYRDLL